MFVVRYAAEGAPSGASVVPEIDDPAAAPFGGREISIADDDPFEYVVEGSEEANAAKAAAPDEAAEFRGKTREDLLGELAKAREAIAAQTKASEPVSALQQTMSQMLGQMRPAEAPIQPGYAAGLNAPQKKMSDAEFEKYINDMMLENPYRAQAEMQARVLEPMLQTMAVNQAQLSREVVLANPETKKVYEKYAQEVEAVVAQTPVETRLRNPRVYQNALETVRARHMDDFVQESLSAKLDEMLKTKLAEYGIDPSKPPVKATPAPGYTAPSSTAGRSASGAASTKQVVAVPQWVANEAAIKGIDKGFLYNHYKAKGLVK